jgi:L-2-hydroxyglutarate oxidase
LGERPIDIAVIGAGIVGLATARELLLRYPALRILVLEKEARPAAHQSGSNSGVLHSGLYYRPGSLKARLCREGYAQMLDYCRRRDVPFAVCGKVIVALGEAEEERLRGLFRRGLENRVPGLRWLDPPQIREVEPHCAGSLGLFVPGTGITDYRLVCERMADDIAASGGEVRLGARVLGFREEGALTIVKSALGDVPARFVINAAGLYSDVVCRLAGTDPKVSIIPFRGEFYELAPERQHLVRALIYPVPDPQLPFLGVHFTRRIQGGVEAGPNAVLAFRREGYRLRDVDLPELAQTLVQPGFWRLARRYWRTGVREFRRSVSRAAFHQALQRLVPELRKEDIVYRGAGVRAQAVDRDGRLVDDFCIIPAGRMIHVLNVPSPAATASLAIASRLAAMAGERFGLAPPAQQPAPAQWVQ